MTVNISKLSGSFLMNQVSMTKTNGSQNMQSDATSFSNFLKSDNNSGANPVKTTSNSDVKEISKYESRPQADKIENSAKTNGSEKETEKADEMINEAAKDVYEQIKETTGVDDEAMKEAMEVLGLSMIDLLEPANLTAVFENVMGIEDSSVLLTNEALSNDLSNLLEATGEITDSLLDDLGMTKEELDSALLSIAEKDMMADENATLADAKENNEDEKESLVIEVNDSRTQNTQTSEKKEATSLEKTQTAEELNPERKVKEHHSENENAAFAGNHQQNSFDFIERLDETQPAESYMSASTEEIVKQIVDQIKINITQSATSMQMELHPESLGHVALTIESREGVITAQFSAQNEIVKEAIESQIAELKENIEAQGIKVEAVEVTVASHEFEQNLQQNNQNAKDNEEAQRVQKTGRRIRLNLSELEESDEELSEEEKIAKEMMEENGNTVDFTA